VPTTLQQLLDALVARAAAVPAGTTIEDVTGALAHLGRALTRLAEDGLTPATGGRQQSVTALARACTTAGDLWPRADGRLTDLAGAAADVVGRERADLGRAQRWAVAVELCAAADHTARAGSALLPRIAVPQLLAVRRRAVDVERRAQADPPTLTAAVALDRVVAAAADPRTALGAGSADAAASLSAALARAVRREELTLRGFRAVTAVAELAGGSGVGLAAAGDRGGTDRLVAAPRAWAAVGRETMAFREVRSSGPAEASGVVGWAHRLGMLLQTTAAGSDPPGTVSPALFAIGQAVANQTPVLAEHLAEAVNQWSRSGSLWAHARALPRMEDMPEDRVRDVIAGRVVRAHGRDLVPLQEAIDRAWAASTALADRLNQVTPPAHRHLAALYRRTADRGERPRDHAERAAEALTLTRPPQPGGAPAVDRS
jgi:hypothetical protein